MRGLAVLPLLLALVACADRRWDPVPGSEGAVKSTAEIRADRRLYDGAPPTIPHDNFGVACMSCHDGAGIAIEGLGFAPTSPHENTGLEGATQRCRQCHVFATTREVFVTNSFRGMEQDMRSGGRLYPGAPPTIPHGVLLRENCAACHSGPGAREGIVTSHPERTRCRQCHVPVTTRREFVGQSHGGGEGGSMSPEAVGRSPEAVLREERETIHQTMEGA